MLSRIQKTPFIDCSVVISSKYKRIGRVTSAKNGVVSTASQVEVIDFAKQNARFNIMDFSIVNLSAVGADKILRPVRFNAVNVDDFIKTSNELLKHAKKVPEKPTE